MKKAILYFTSNDNELSGIAIPCDAEYYEEAFENIKSMLESEEFVNHIIEKFCIYENQFNDDDTFKFDKVTHSRAGLKFTFVNDEDEEVGFLMQEQFIELFD